MSTPTPLEIVQRATFSLSVTWKDSATPAVPISLAGYYAHMQIRSKAGAAGDPLVDVTSAATGGATPDILLEPNDRTGVVEVRIPATKTAQLTKNCVYDLFLIKSNDPTEATRLIFGPIAVSRAVTVT